MSFISQVKACRIKLVATLCRLLPLQRRKLLFWSDLGHRYSCNPRYLCEYLLKHHPGEFDLVWMFDQSARIPEDFPKRVRIVRYFSLRWLYEVATARAIICNHRIPGHFFFQRRKRQQYIQTWHSSLRLKMIEQDAGATLGNNYISNAIRDSKQITCLISGCAFSSEIFQKSFWYDGPVLECGTPRIDYLMKERSRRTELCHQLHLAPEVHYVLYAPTFRKSMDLKAYDLNAEHISEALKKRFGGEWKILFRLHPNLAPRVSEGALPACGVNMSSHPDIQELLIISDILLTDYSSCMFDMAYLSKICLLYANDVEEYMKADRGMYFQLSDLPFPLARNNDELSKQIECFDSAQYQRDLQAFMKKIGTFESGTACKTITENLLSNH